MRQHQDSLDGARALLPLLAAAALALSACSGAEEQAGANDGSLAAPRQAILILLDAARSDRFSSYGYPVETTPEMDALAANGALFPQHYTQGRGTRFALPIVLYSRYYTRNLLPYVMQIPVATSEELFRGRREDTISLPKAFEAAGFHTAMISAHTWLQVETEFASEFVEPHDLPNEIEYDRLYAYPRAEEVIDYTLDWLRLHESEDFFLYVHLMDTHFPHFFDEDAQALFGATEYETSAIDRRGRVTDVGGELSDTDKRYLDALYDGSLRYTDRQIGRLAAFLREEGRLETTLIAVTADHGDMLLEHPGAWEHGGTMYEQLARIPFVIHYPVGLEPMRIPGFSELVDVAPTLLGLMDVELPPGKTMDGANLVEAARGNQPAKREAFARRMIRTERYKADFWNPDADLLRESPPLRHRAVRANIFDLQSDPREEIELGQDVELRSGLFDLYRERMLPYYAKFVAAPQSGQPDGPFAVGSNQFELSVDAPSRKGQPPIAELLAIESDDGWTRMHGKRALRESWVFARGDARPVTLGVEVPDGQYLIAIGLTGSARFAVPTVDGVQTIHAKSEWFGEQPYQKAETVDLGLVEVRDQKVELTVTPDPERPWLLLRYMGFWPAKEGQAVRGDAPDEAMIERLRTLGYID